MEGDLIASLEVIVIVDVELPEVVQAFLVFFTKSRSQLRVVNKLMLMVQENTHPQKWGKARVMW